MTPYLSSMGLWRAEWNYGAGEVNRKRHPMTSSVRRSDKFMTRILQFRALPPMHLSRIITA